MPKKKKQKHNVRVLLVDSFVSNNDKISNKLKRSETALLTLDKNPRCLPSSRHVAAKA